MKTGSSLNLTFMIENTIGTVTPSNTTKEQKIGEAWWLPLHFIPFSNNGPLLKQGLEIEPGSQLNLAGSEDDRVIDRRR